MNETQNNRIKASMVVFQLEQDLGTYITSHADSISEISDNIVDKVTNNENIENMSLNQLLSKAYLDDIFSVALDISKGQSDHEKIKKLKNICQSLDLYSIRNAIAHPNKTFSLNYWYRVAAIATDPLIEMLGLTNVVTAFNNAKNGTIASPPNDWLSKPIWILPNNLPENFDHSITGFVGRHKEKAEINKLIYNKRHSFIAITGPGGLGKTAIVLELLNELSLDPKSCSIVDAILFVSMKTEELTAGGIRKIDAVNTIEKLKKEILLSLQYIFNDEDIANFKDAIMKYNDKNVLLFVDNLETLLRDNPQEFCELIDELPPCYRVIVSSRIPVDAAISYPLNQMTDIDAAILARNYARRRSIQYLQDKDFQYISNKLQNNPLAIRLCIDTLLSSGKKLNELLNDVSGDIAEYSYKNLIESISENSVEILELLFLQKSLTREEIAELLGKNIDDIATSIAQLRKTSLLLSSQLDSEEIYYINEGIRNFLMLSERNLKIREQIYNKLRKNQAILNEINNRRKETHKNNMWFIPDNLPKELQKIIFSISKQSRKKDNFAEIKKLFNLLTVNEHMYEKYDIYWRMKAHLLSKLKDIYQAEECINKALSMDEESFINNYQLVKFYFYSRQDYVASEYLLKKIIEKLDSYELDNYLIREVYSYFYLSELYQNKYDTIIEQTKDWKDRPIIRGVLGSIRARALKRIAEQKNGIEKFNLLYRAIRIITDTINQDGELKMTKSTISEIVEHLNSITNNKYISLLTEKQKNAFDLFLDRFDTSLKTDNISSKNNTCENIISNFLFENTINQKITEGYINTFIYKIPDVRWGYTQYIFSKDENDNEYFIHFDNCKDIEWDDWKKLKIGDEVVVKANKILNPQNKARPIEDAIFF